MERDSSSLLPQDFEVSIDSERSEHETTEVNGVPGVILFRLVISSRQGEYGCRCFESSGYRHSGQRSERCEYVLAMIREYGELDSLIQFDVDFSVAAKFG